MFTKPAYARDTYEGNWSLEGTVLKMGAVCSNITQQKGHFIDSDPVVDFNVPQMDWVSKHKFDSYSSISFSQTINRRRKKNAE
jgi:hypothetical protein